MAEEKENKKSGSQGLLFGETEPNSVTDTMPAEPPDKNNIHLIKVTKLIEHCEKM